MNKPKHYQDLGIDIIDFCMENNLDFMQGNIIKYVVRYKNKGGIDDLMKAKNYLNRLINNEKGKPLCPPEQSN